MTWQLAIDVGTTATAAAVCIDGERRVLELEGAPRMPSVVFAPASGPLMVGSAAERQMALEPERAEPTPKRRLGDPVILLAGRPVEPIDAVGAILDSVLREAVRFNAGSAPSTVVLTHPAVWGRRRLDLLVDAAARAGIASPTFVAEPVAAAAHLAGDLVRDGELLCVYDLGGGTFDVAMLRRRDAGFSVAGPPGGDERLGGESLDDRVASYLLARLPDEARRRLEQSSDRTRFMATWELRGSARDAKEALSSAREHTIYLRPPLDLEVTLGRDELEAVIGELLETTIVGLERTIERAGATASDLSALVLVGGASRTPMVERLLARTVGGRLLTWGDPKAVVALGALTDGLAGNRSVASVATADPEPVPPRATADPEPVPPRATADPEPFQEPDAMPDVVEDLAVDVADLVAPRLDRDEPAVQTKTIDPDERERIGTIVAVTLVAVGLLLLLVLLLT